MYQRFYRFKVIRSFTGIGFQVEAAVDFQHQRAYPFIVVVPAQGHQRSGIGAVNSHGKTPVGKKLLGTAGEFWWCMVRIGAEIKTGALRVLVDIALKGCIGKRVAVDE